ncbi:MAG: family 43 glycosylhydrolase [Clostridiales bacterium]|nr:family 43 glycosylhydrolase [Clostridiales bacterium]
MKNAAFNPYLAPWEYIPDGEPKVFGDRVYLFGSHDEAGGTRYCTGDYVCWSAAADDLSSWQYEGVIYCHGQDPDDPEGTQAFYAPDVVQGLDGRYYLYYTLDYTYHISVAVCDTPAGQYEYYGTIKSVEGGRLETELPYDPAVLVDGGRIWLYYGFCPTFKMTHMPEIPKTSGCLCVELAADMLTCLAQPHCIAPNKANAVETPWEGHAFFEAASMRLMDGTYYLVYCSEHSHELCYATSLKPDSEFVYGGVLVSNGDIGYQGRLAQNARNAYANIHGGMAMLKDELYIFYHRHTHGTQFSRQGCAERLQIAQDGSFEQAEMTSFGLMGGEKPAIGTLPSWCACNLYKGDGAKAIRFGPPNVDGPYLVTDPEERQGGKAIAYLSNITDDCVIGFRYLHFSGEEQHSILIIRGKGEGVFTAYADDAMMIPIGSAPVKIDGDQWQQVTLVLSPKAGKYPFLLHYKGNGILQLDWVDIQ